MGNGSIRRRKVVVVLRACNGVCGVVGGGRKDLDSVAERRKHVHELERIVPFRKVTLHHRCFALVVVEKRWLRRWVMEMEGG